MYVNSNNRRAYYNGIYCNSLEDKHILEEIKKFIGNKNIIINVYRIQAYDSIMCGYFRIGSFDFMRKGTSLLEYAILFSSNNYEEIDKIIVKHFQ